MTFSTFLTKTTVITLLVSFPLTLHAQNFQECLDQVSEEIERTLCELKRVSRNPELPNIQEFKKNPPTIQRLLIKREAEAYGISLPDTTPKEQQNKTPSPTRSDIASAQKPSEKPSLFGCELRQDHIQCPGEYYQHIRNKKNSQLKAEAFSSHNELIFAGKSESEFKEQSDYRYLSSIYPTYIHKMLTIGLGDSTMSFTKFATIYWQSKKESSGFSARFRQIYNQLKIEKSRNQISGRYTQNYPESIDKCVRMDRSIIICDNKNQNWVYKLK